MRALFITLCLAFSGAAFAGNTAEVPPAGEIPISEKEFVSVINQYDKARIIEQFGEPDKKDDMKVGQTGEVIASIWQYHFINTDAEGAYYETTELDFVGEKVVMVVFMNHDGSDKIRVEPPAATPAPEALPRM
ncbi:hypothetical protein MTYP_00397 [Methylophilaceae bacterium]|nr:hypothetical protein MTYP_00397 [Methylophilaceae bacterium]